MIGKVYSQNVHKNRQWTQQLLTTLYDEYDLILIQEPPYYHVKNIPSGDNSEGVPEHDTCHDPKWSKVFFNTNVSVYVNEKVLRTHSLFLFPSFDPNIIALTLHNIEKEDDIHFINCYNDTSKDTLRNLLSFLERQALQDTVIMGDFNLHSDRKSVV